MSYSRERLGELLVRADLITPEQLEAALGLQATAGGKLGEVLVRELVVTEDQIAEALAKQKDLPHVNLAAYPIDTAAVTLLPVRMARRKSVIPIGFEEGHLVLAMADPLDVEAIDETEIRTGMKVRPVVATASQVHYAIEKYTASADAISELELSAPDAAQETEAVGEGDVPVVRMINQLLRDAIVDGASDVHFEPEEDSVRVRVRVDGVLSEVARLPKGSQAELLSRVKVMAELDITERRRPQDGRISLKVGDRVIDMRVATLPTPAGEAIVLRILNSNVSFHVLEELGMSVDALGRFRRMLERPYGAVFIAGPTGSGKSTTLYAALNEIADVARKTITVEDPIEFRMPGITQMAVNPRVGLTFATGLRTILRSDPDIVMVGEIRDSETAEIAIRAALTGHLVLSSIHTNDAPSALTRLTDMGVESYITSSALVGAVAQRLVRVLCPKCKEKVDVSADLLLAAGFSASEVEGLTVYGPVGCSECRKTGYEGRIGVFEVMEMDDDLVRLYLRDAPSEELRELAISKGMTTLRRDALDKVAAGITSLEELDRVVV